MGFFPHGFCRHEPRKPRGCPVDFSTLGGESFSGKYTEETSRESLAKQRWTWNNLNKRVIYWQGQGTCYQKWPRHNQNHVIQKTTTTPDTRKFHICLQKWLHLEPTKIEDPLRINFYKHQRRKNPMKIPKVVVDFGWFMSFSWFWLIYEL